MPSETAIPGLAHTSDATPCQHNEANTGRASAGRGHEFDFMTRTSLPPAGRAPGPTTRNRPPAARATRPGPGRLRDAGSGRDPVAHRRRPDRARLVQVVRPVGRSTWTRRTRPGRA